MVAAIDGDQKAYGTLLREVAPMLRRAVQRKLRVDDVEDVVQEILISLHSARHTYEPDRPFFPWLFTIANRRIVDHLRQARQAGRLSKADYALLRGGDSTAAQLDDEMAVTAIFRSWLPGLTKSQRIAVELLKLRGLTLTEAASESGMSSTALKVAVHRAMKALRHDLAEGMA